MDKIKFGTDGWRGVIAQEFTFDRLLKVAPVAAQVLLDTFGAKTQNRRIMVGATICVLLPRSLPLRPL
jgi:phosphomannomutase